MGTERDALKMAAGTNVTHGLRRTRADTQNAIVKVLQDGEMRSWSSNALAKIVGVAPQTVEAVREKLARERLAKTGETAPVTRQYQRGGKIVTIQAPVRNESPDPETLVLRMVDRFDKMTKELDADVRRRIAEGLRARVASENA